MGESTRAEPAAGRASCCDNPYCKHSTAVSPLRYAPLAQKRNHAPPPPSDPCAGDKEHLQNVGGDMGVVKGPGLGSVQVGLVQHGGCCCCWPTWQQQ
jgi:hypothetical protein